MPKHKKQLNLFEKAGSGYQIAHSKPIQPHFVKERKSKKEAIHEETQNTLPQTMKAIKKTFKKAITKMPDIRHSNAKVRAKINRKMRKLFSKAVGDPISPKIGPLYPKATPSVSNIQSHSELLNQARQGNTSILSNPKIHIAKDPAGMTGLHHLARQGKTEVLSHPQVSTVTDSFNRTPLSHLAEAGKTEVLNHPDVAGQRDKFGRSPLHYLARTGNTDVLSHPQVSKISDLEGKTPLHSLAFHKPPEMTSHPDFDKVRDSGGRTPKDIFNGTQPSPSVEKAFAKYFGYFNLIKSDPVQQKLAVNNLPINIEWPKGSVRKYKNDTGELKDGKKMAVAYGYFPGTTSDDGEEIDTYVGDNLKSTKVYLLEQKTTNLPSDIQRGTNRPEDKYMLGFDSIQEAEKAYKRCMPSKFFGSIKEIAWKDLIYQLKHNKAKQTKSLKKSVKTKGFDPIAKERAIKSGLIILPDNIKGTNCGTCKWFDKKLSFCKHKEVYQSVGPNFCCDFWYKSGTKIPEGLSIKEYNQLKKALANMNEAYNQMAGYSPHGVGFKEKNQMQKAGIPKKTDTQIWNQRIEKAKKKLKLDLKNKKLLKSPLFTLNTTLRKDLSSLPSVTSYQGDRSLGPMYNSSESAGSSISKSFVASKKITKNDFSSMEKKVKKAFGISNKPKYTPSDFKRMASQQRAAQGYTAALQHKQTGKIHVGQPGEIHEDIIHRVAQNTNNHPISVENQHRTGFVNKKGNWTSRVEVERKTGAWDAADVNDLKIQKSGPFGNPPFDEPNEVARTLWEERQYDRKPYKNRDGSVNHKAEKHFKRDKIHPDIQKSLESLSLDNLKLVIKL